MTSRSYRTKTWIDPRQEFRASLIQGIGSFARTPIKQGEVVEILGGMVMTAGEFRAFVQTLPRFNAIQIDEQLHLVEVPEVTVQRGGGALSMICVDLSRTG